MRWENSIFFSDSENLPRHSNQLLYRHILKNDRHCRRDPYHPELLRGQGWLHEQQQGGRLCTRLLFFMLKMLDILTIISHKFG